jgi:membrane protease YdiL (CAAX protease family)
MFKIFYRFIFNPYIPTQRKPRIKEFIQLLFIYVLMIFPLGFISNYVVKKLNITHFNFSKQSTLLILLGVFIIPIFEEILFRSWLKWSKRNVYILIVSIICVVTISYFHHRFQHIRIMILFLFIVVGLIYLLKNIKAEPFIVNHFKYFFWSSSIIFGLVHASNYTGNIWYLIGFSFILGSPQIVGGFILGFIRMNYGLRYSILFHFLINSSLLLSLLHR